MVHWRYWGDWIMCLNYEASIALMLVISRGGVEKAV